MQLDALGGQRLTEGVAERLRLAGQRVVHALHHGHRGPEAEHRLRHLHTNRTAAEHQHPLGHLAQLRHLAVGPDAIQLGKPRDRRHDRLGPGGEHDVLAGELAVVHHHAACTRDRARAAQDVDALRAQPRLLRGVLPVPRS